MIIKSIRWKRANKFSFMVKYIDKEIEQNRENDTFSICHNFGSRNHFRSLVDEFERNDTHRKKRKNGVVFYHEVLSFSKLDRKNISLEMLADVAERYIAIRADNALVYARPHLNQEHPHIHFIISGNELNSRKVTRLDNQAYRKVRLEMERYQLEKYGQQLENSFVYLTNWERQRNVKLDKPKAISDKEYQIKKRGKQTHKERIALLVKSSFDIAYSMEHFTELLQEDNIKLYYVKDQLMGIQLAGGRKHRFRNLGIDQDMLRELSHRSLESQAKFEQLKESQTKNLVFERELNNSRLNELQKVRNQSRNDGTFHRERDLTRN